MRKAAKFLLVFLGVVIDLTAIYMVMLSLQMVSLPAQLNFAHFLTEGEAYSLLGFLVFLIGMPLIIYGAGIKTKTEEKVNDMGSRQNRASQGESVRLATTLGEIFISFQALENLVLRASRDIQGIRETRTKIKNSEQGLVVNLWIKVIPEQGIPQLVEQLQENVRSYVTEKSGAAVAEVKVMVENVIVSGMER